MQADARHMWARQQKAKKQPQKKRGIDEGGEQKSIQLRKQEHCLPYLLLWRLNKNISPQPSESLSAQLLEKESRVRAATDRRQTGWWMHRHWVTHVQWRTQSVWLPGSHWVALVTSGEEWMIDEDVWLQMDHQISGYLYLMQWCNQSHTSTVCPPLDERPPSPPSPKCWSPVTSRHTLILTIMKKHYLFIYLFI